MGIIANNKGKQFTLPPTGTHLAYCVGVIDLGTQVENYGKEVKSQHKCMFVFELPDEKHVFDQEKGEEPFSCNKEFTLSLNDKATLRAQLESWRGQPFTPQELEGFDISKVIGAPAMVNITHYTNRKGGQSYKINSISKVPKAMVKPKGFRTHNPLRVYEIPMGENDVFQSLPQWIQDKIKASAEFNAPDPSEDVQDDSPGDEPQSGPGNNDDDVPF